jgi:hypothetical protein
MKKEEIQLTNRLIRHRLMDYATIVQVRIHTLFHFD